MELLKQLFKKYVMIIIKKSFWTKIVQVIIFFVQDGRKNADKQLFFV